MSFRRPAEVVDARAVGAYGWLACRDDGPAPRPGQFYMLAAIERWGGGEDERPFLPRAFSYLRYTPDAPSPAREGMGSLASPPAHEASGTAATAGILEFLWEDVGPGTRRLSELRPGDQLWLLGPLGNGFERRSRPLLVGGGIGIVPLACWQDATGAAALLGFRDARHAAAAELMRGEVRLATDDGSVGHGGFVTELLVGEVDADPTVTVYACGPPPMLKAVRAICAEREVPAQLALETGMACGFGACFGCVVPTRHGYVRLCIDGPVLAGDALEGVPAA
jgi:dihydroorotate dehydrogenase electron transfer subunit